MEHSKSSDCTSRARKSGDVGLRKLSAHINASRSGLGGAGAGHMITANLWIPVFPACGFYFPGAPRINEKCIPQARIDGEKLFHMQCPWIGCCGMAVLSCVSPLAVWCCTLLSCPLQEGQAKKRGGWKSPLASDTGRAAARREFEAKCPQRHVQTNYAQCAHSIQHPAWVAATFHTGCSPPC